MNQGQQKEAAARESLRFVRDGQIVGLGTGSTATIAVKLIGERVKAGLKIQGIPTSARTAELAKELGIPLVTLDQYQQIDVTIDGADEINPQLQLIKGGGGALLREKIIASATKQMVVVGDASKKVAILGKFPLPVEVVSFAQTLVAKEISSLGAKVKLRQNADGSPYKTDEGHHILDCSFGQIPDPSALANVLDGMPGVMGHGLFINLASVALIATDSGVKEFKRAGTA
jgi:ribose 5-phosphate isomerase A